MKCIIIILACTVVVLGIAVMASGGVEVETSVKVRVGGLQWNATTEHDR